MGIDLDKQNLDPPVTPEAHAPTHEKGSDPVDHDSLDGFVADEHIDWKDTSENFKTTGTAEVGEIKIKVYKQIAEPVLAADDYIAMWIDTDSVAPVNQTWLVFRRGVGDQVRIELS